MPEITLSGPDGSFGAYLALPETRPAPAIIVAQEIFWREPSDARCLRLAGL